MIKNNTDTDLITYSKDIATAVAFIRISITHNTITEGFAL